MTKKNALGRGLSALIDDTPSSAIERRMVNTAPVVSLNDIELDNIVPNPLQPRQNFDDEALNELASSIKALGVIQPVTVREIESGKYQLISGERRFRASIRAGLTRIPAYIRKANDTELLEMALVENVQREDLDSIEVAITYQRLMDECNLTQENLSERVGKKRATVANYVRLLRLPAEIQSAIREKKISFGHARTLLGLDDPMSQINVFQKIINEDLSVRKVEDMIREMHQPKLIVEKIEPVKKEKEDDEEVLKKYEEVKNTFTGFFSTKVDFTKNDNGSGKIVIAFKNEEELSKILEKIVIKEG